MSRRRVVAAVAALVALLASAPADAAPHATRHPLQRALGRYGDASPGDRWTGGDATYSVVLPDGRTVWSFGDTFLGVVNRDRSRDRQGFVHNTWVVQERDGRFSRTLHRRGYPPGALVETGDPATWYWPGALVVEGRKLRQVLWRVTGAGPAFGIVGADVATFSLPRLILDGVAASPGGFRPSAPPGGAGPIAFGVAMVPDGRYTYVFGCENVWPDKYLHVARVPRGRLLRGPWEYWDGARWTRDPLRSVRLLGRVADELSVVRTRDGFRLVAQDAGIGREIYAYTARRPEGPWGGRTLLYRTPEHPARQVTYNAKEHPQLGGPGHVVVSYNVNVTAQDPDGLYRDVDNYRPRFVRLRMRSGLPARR